MLGRPGATADANNMTWAVCTDVDPGAQPLMKPDQVSLAPDPPHHGRTMFINVTGTSPSDVAEGSLAVTVLFHGYRVWK